MEVIVFSSSGCELIQNEESVSRDLDIDYDLKYVCYKYNINNNDLFQINETTNSFFLRLFGNLLTLLMIGGIHSSENLRNIQYNAYKQNKKLASFIFMPLLRMRGKIKIKPIKCTDDTVVCIYLLKSKIPFMVDVFDGEIEIIENKRGFKI
ncbi:MAG: hypothetical protein IJX78_01425 [Bacilli bacterium]|nr:hypothetical protein [Bacilli bacterium]